MAKGNESQKRQAMIKAASFRGGPANRAVADELIHNKHRSAVTILKGLDFMENFAITITLIRYLNDYPGIKRAGK
jgi:hypothetical protein